MPSTLIRLWPSIGNLGSTPIRMLPDSDNAGDFGHALIGARHQYGLTADELLAAKTDGHLDCMDVRPGAVLIVPVKVRGVGSTSATPTQPSAKARSRCTASTSRRT